MIKSFHCFIFICINSRMFLTQCFVRPCIRYFICFKRSQFTKKFLKKFLCNFFVWILYVWDPFMCMFFYEFLWPSCEFCAFFYASHDGPWWSLYVYICIYFVFRFLFQVHIIWLCLFFGFLFIFYFLLLFLFCCFWGVIFTCISLSRGELDNGQ